MMGASAMIQKDNFKRVFNFIEYHSLEFGTYSFFHFITVGAKKILKFHKTSYKIKKSPMAICRQVNCDESSMGLLHKPHESVDSAKISCFVPQILEILL